MLIVANWKMNPRTSIQATVLAKQIAKAVTARGVKVAIAPPFLFLGAVNQAKGHAVLAAQDMYWEEQGAHTGEVSPSMLNASGVKYVLIGHSERRALGETDEMINKKMRAALSANITPILCVGESKEIRAKGISLAKEFVVNQIQAALKDISQKARIVVAYEPVWAIGANEPDKPENANDMAHIIRETLPRGMQAEILYGGSVGAANARSFLSQKEIDGALVGGASLKADEFNKIIGYREKRKK